MSSILRIEPSPQFDLQERFESMQRNLHQHQQDHHPLENFPFFETGHAIEETTYKFKESSGSPPSLKWRIFKKHSSKSTQVVFPVSATSTLKTVSQESYQLFDFETEVSSDAVDAIPYPFLREQFYSVFYTISKSPWSEEDKEKLFTRLIQLIPSFEKNAPSVLNKTQLPFILGKFLFVFNLYPEKIQAHLTSSKEVFDKEINTLFFSSIHCILETITTTCLAHKETGLQFHLDAYNVYLSNALAEMLITNLGMINTGIIPLLIQVFLTHASDIPQDTRTIQTLKNILQDKPLRISIYEIEKPEAKHKKAQLLVSLSTFSSPLPEESITKAAVKKVASASLLSKIRQGKDGSCFVMLLMIALQSSNPGLVITDFRNLLEHEKLVAQTHSLVAKSSETISSFNKFTESYPFHLAPTEYYFNQIVSLNEKGIIQSSDNTYSKPIWESPGLIKVARFLEIDSLKERLLEYIESQITPFKISLKEILFYLINLKGITEQDKILTTFLLFEAEVTPLLTKVWKDALGSLSSNGAGILTRKISESLFFVIDTHLKNKFKNDPLTSDIITHLKNNFNSHSLLSYNSGLSNQAFGFPFQGAFHLMHQGKEITTAYEFQEFCAFICTEIKKEEYQEHIDFLLKEVLFTDDFIISVIKKHDPSTNISSIHDISSIHTTHPHTLWLFRTGGFAHETYIQYFSDRFKVTLEEKTPQSPEEVLQIVIDIAKKNRDLPKAEAKLPKYGFSQGSHACNLEPAQALMILSYLEKKKISLDNYLSNVLMPNYENLSEKKLKEEEMNACIEKVATLFFSKITREKEAFIHSCHTSLKKPYKIKKIYQVVSQLLAQKRPHVSNIDLGNKAVDKILYDILPEKLKTAFKNLAITIADSNASHEGKNLLLCIFCSPGSSVLSFWYKTEDGNLINPVKETLVASHLQWKFLNVECISTKESTLN